MSADVLLVLSLSNFKYRNILFFHSHYDPFIGKSFSQIVSRDSSKKDRTGLTRYSKVKVQSLDMAIVDPVLVVLVLVLVLVLVRMHPHHLQQVE